MARALWAGPGVSPARRRGRRRVRAAPGRLPALRRRVGAGRAPPRAARPADAGGDGPARARRSSRARAPRSRAASCAWARCASTSGACDSRQAAAAVAAGRGALRSGAATRLRGGARCRRPRWLAAAACPRSLAATSSAAVRELAGRGEGLTPVGDDVLAGFAAMRHARGRPVSFDECGARRSGARTCAVRSGASCPRISRGGVRRPEPRCCGG